MLVYADLDSVIDATSFTRQEKVVLLELMEGTTQAELAKKFGVDKRAISKLLRQVTEKICRTNYELMLDWLGSRKAKGTCY